MSRKGKLFCEINPFCYAISEKKEHLKRHLKDLRSKDHFSKTKKQERLAAQVCEHRSRLIKRAPGVDPVSQENKAVNVRLACEKISGMIIRPGEVFSFWRTVGKTSKRKGYKEGRVIQGNKIITGVGGGLCNLGNTIHLLVLHSPLDVVEFHKHSDALAPDEGKRVPFAAGTSVCYNHIDYRFQNNTDQEVQLLLWVEEEQLCGEIRCEREFPHTYRLVEEDHHFKKEGEKFYRNSMIYREVLDRASGEVIKKELILKNHSEVLFDHALIPKELIRP